MHWVVIQDQSHPESTGGSKFNNLNRIFTFGPCFKDPKCKILSLIQV